MSPSLAVMGAESRCNENSRSGGRSSTRDAWSCGRGGSSWRKQETGEQRRREGRSTRRRRRALCAVSAVIAGYAAASLPCGTGFVSPVVQQAGRSAAAAVPSYVRSAAPGGGESRRAGMRRRRPSDAVHMVGREHVSSRTIVRGRARVAQHMTAYAHVTHVSSPVRSSGNMHLFFHGSFFIYCCTKNNMEDSFVQGSYFNPPAIISHAACIPPCVFSPHKAMPPISQVVYRRYLFL